MYFKGKALTLLEPHSTRKNGIDKQLLNNCFGLICPIIGGYHNWHDLTSELTSPCLTRLSYLDGMLYIIVFGNSCQPMQTFL